VTEKILLKCAEAAMVTFYRRLPKFDYLSPSTLEQAISMLSEHRGKIRIIAGGTDLIPKLKHRDISSPQYILDIKGIPALNYIRLKEGSLRLGALTTIEAVENSALIKEKFNILWQAANSMASVQIRNRGTIAGNICNAVPSADTAPALLTLDAKVKLVSRRGIRLSNINKFFTGPNKSIVAEDEILEEIQIPPLLPDSRCLYLKLTQRHVMDLAVVGVAVVCRIDKDICRDIRIALGSVSPLPMRAEKTESMIRGKQITSSLIDTISHMAAEESKPISDHRASAEYRRDMVRVLVKRAIEQLMGSSAR